MPSGSIGLSTGKRQGTLIDDGHGMPSALELGLAEETGAIEVLNIQSFIDIINTEWSHL